MDQVADFLLAHKWLMQVGALLTGFWAAAVLNPWIGLGAIALAVASIAVSRFGMKWGLLSDREKLIVVPGLVIGFAGVGLLIFLLYLMWIAFISVVREL